MTMTKAPSPERHVKMVAFNHLRPTRCVRRARSSPGLQGVPLHSPHPPQCLPPPLLPAGAHAARYLLGRGLLGVGVIVGESPVERGDVQTAVGTSEQAQPGLAGGRVAHGGIGEVQALWNALHQHCPGGWGVVSATGGPETTDWNVSAHLSAQGGRTTMYLRVPVPVLTIPCACAFVCLDVWKAGCACGALCVCVCPHV